MYVTVGPKKADYVPRYCNDNGDNTMTCYQFCNSPTELISFQCSGSEVVKTSTICDNGCNTATNVCR